MRRATVGFITLGCPKNEVDTERMRALIAASPYGLAERLGDADVVVLNTCSFIREATEESIAAVLDLASEWLPAGNDRRLIVAGCMPSRYGGELASALPEVAAFVPVAEEGALITVLDRVTGVTTHVTDTRVRREASGPSAYLQVSDGCHRRCAYCTIPSIRGPYRSHPLDELVEEAHDLVATGAREIILIGQDITSYGRDLDSGQGIEDVVDAIARVPGVRWLRLMYAQPDGVTRSLLKVMASHDNICHYLDIPLQHASPSVLRGMRRRGDSVSYLGLVRRIRAALPDAVLRTTLMTGFPGETRADAALVRRFIEAADFDYVGIFAFSPEEGTDAAVMPHQVSLRTRRARAQRLRDLADRIGTRHAEALVGRTLEVLVEGTDSDEGAVIGRWRGQAPEIDGVVLLDRGEPGDIVRARIVDSYGYDLQAEVV